MLNVERPTLHYRVAINNDKKWFETVKKIKLIMLIDVGFRTQHDHPTHALSVSPEKYIPILPLPWTPSFQPHKQAQKQ